MVERKLEAALGGGGGHLIPGEGLLRHAFNPES